MSEKDSNLYLELGQVIQFNAPQNSDLHEQIFLIEYLDNTLLKLVNYNTLTNITLNLKNNSFLDESITGVVILYEPEVKGYARQNELVVGKWVSVEFGGELPTIINGKITNLEEDMIELTTYPDENVIYIDFGYKGIPLDIPIKSIKEFDPPEKAEQELSPVDDSEKSPNLDDMDELEEDIEADDLELIVDTEVIKQNIQDVFIDLDEITIEDNDLGEIIEQIDVSEEKRRYGIESQTNDLLDELLSSVPSNKRTAKVLNNIHIMIERFKQLRRNFSKFDEQGNAETIIKKGANYKPLVEKLKRLNHKLYWLMPIVKNKHKIYDIDIPTEESFTDVVPIHFGFSASEEIDIIKQYRQNTVPDGQNKYKYLYTQLNPYMTPFRNSVDNENIIDIKEVHENLDAVCDNLDDFYSTMVQNESISRERFVIDRYNLGLKQLHNPDPRNKKSKVKIINLTKSDEMVVKGFLTLPQPYLIYSHITLPNTSILKKANLHNFSFQYFNILNKDTEVDSATIPPLEEGEVYESEADKLDKNEKAVKKYMTKVKSYDFEENLKYVDRENNEIYENFLKSIVPKTRVLFNLIKKYIKNGTSYSKIIEYLEPFLIYQDDITFKQYEEILNFIEIQIAKHKKKLIDGVKNFNEYLGIGNNYYVPSIFPQLIKGSSLSDNDEIFGKSGYNYNETVSTQISLKKMIDYDCGSLLFHAIALSSLEIFQPIDLDAQIELEQKQIQDNLEGKKNEKECESLVLAKKYIDIDELEADNDDTFVFFDKKYDDTMYDIGKAWLDQYRGTTDSDSHAIRELKQFLIENNGVDPNRAERDAESMVFDGKLVKNGEYAILDLGDGDLKYYKRDNDRWKLDKSLTNKPEDQISFCNTKPNCLAIKKECSTIETSKQLIKDSVLKEIENRFEDDLKESIQQLRNRITKEFEYRKEQIIYLKKYKTLFNIKNSLKKIKIAEQLEARDVIVSPYEELRDLILSQSDIVKRMNDIIIFCEKYCRDVDFTSDYTEEDYAWFLCQTTGVKLMPTFFEELARAFKQGRYQEELDRIKSERGKISDDGDKWIDKYSGYYICNIDYDTAEGYDESGYKIVSRDVMDLSIEDKFSSKVKDDRFDYQSQLAQKIHLILKSLDSFLHISTKNEYDFVVRLTSDCLNKYMYPEKKYRAMVKRAEKQGKRKKPYEQAYDEIFLFSIISAYIIAIQTSTPSIYTDRTYPTCTKSFTGFPLDGNSDMSCLTYITCVLLNTRTDNRPWKYLPKSSKRTIDNKTEAYVGKLKKFMTDKILSIDYVQEKLREKIVYNSEVKNMDIVLESYDIQNWNQFLPPLEPASVKKISNVGNGFSNTVNKHIRNNSFEQFPHLWSLYGKMVSYSFGIIESVQRAINNEPLILTAKSNGIPFTENACCNEGEVNTVKYFSEKEKSIIRYNEIIKDLSRMYYFYKYSTRAPMFSLSEDTKIKFPKIIKDFSVETVYLSFIKYCKFNTGIVLDDQLMRLCVRNNCDFNKNDPIKEKIKKMQEEGLNYSNDSLSILLNIINKQNILQLDLDPSIITEKIFLEQTVNYLKEQNDLLICHPRLLDFLLELVDRFDIDIIEGEEDETFLEFKQFLTTTVNDMSFKLVEKMTEHNSLKKRYQDLIQLSSNKVKRDHFILNMMERGDEIYMNKQDETGFATFELLKMFTINLCKTYPTIILNKVDYQKRYVPKHWNLSGRHQQDVMNIMTNDYKDFTQFYGDKKLDSVLKYVLDNNENLLMLLDSIPFYAGIKKDNNSHSIMDGSTVKKLGYYFLLCSLSLYVAAFDQDFDTEETKETIDNGNDMDEMMDDGVDASILRGRREQIEETTCALMSSYLKKLEEYKKIFDVDRETIDKRVLKSKEKEKSKITFRLKELTVEEREIENIMKNQSLGEWSVGQTRAIFEYDEKQYDKEREEIEQDALYELQSGVRDEVTEFNRDIYKMEYLEKMASEMQIQREVNDISQIAEDGEELGDSVDYM